MSLKIISTNYRPFAVNDYIKVRVHHEDDFTCHLYLDDFWVMTARIKALTSKEEQVQSEDNVYCMMQAKKSSGVFTSPHYCPQPICDIIADDIIDETPFLFALLRAFQSRYCCNNSNYSFSKDAYEDLLRRYFIYPRAMAQKDKGASLIHLFMPHVFDSD